MVKVLKLGIDATAWTLNNGFKALSQVAKTTLFVGKWSCEDLNHFPSNPKDTFAYIGKIITASTMIFATYKIYKGFRKSFERMVSSVAVKIINDKRKEAKSTVSNKIKVYLDSITEEKKNEMLIKSLEFSFAKIINDEAKRNSLLLLIRLYLHGNEQIFQELETELSLVFLDEAFAANFTPRFFEFLTKIVPMWNDVQIDDDFFNSVQISSVSKNLFLGFLKAFHSKKWREEIIRFLNVSGFMQIAGDLYLSYHSKI
ncbi:MAG: hypothetical protein JXA94_01685 [Parachlamydiales bacterium]|nr:hypothetical protein [Parachlamydiales bacterium]